MDRQSSRQSNYNNSGGRVDDWCPPGISGPRRTTTEEPIETAAANAEATRLAQQLGLSSSLGSTSRTVRISGRGPIN